MHVHYINLIHDIKCLPENTELKEEFTADFKSNGLSKSYLRVVKSLQAFMTYCATEIICTYILQ